MSDEDIDARSESLNTAIKSLRELQRTIEDHTVDQHDETAYEQEQEYRYDFEELYTTIITKLLTKKKLNQRQQEQQQRAQHHNEQQLHDQQQIRESIPKIQFQPLGASETFNNFKRRLEAYFRLNNITKDQTKTNIILSTLSPELHERLCDLVCPEEPINMSFDLITETLNEYVDPKPSKWALQHKFISRIQKSDETIAQFTAELKKLTTNCEFNCQHCEKNTSESFLCLQFIRGLKDNDVRTKILQDQNKCTFKELVQIATSIEMGKTENDTIATNVLPSTSNGSIDKVSTNTYRPKTSNSRQITRRDLLGKCFRCGSSHESRICNASNVTCRKCNKIGHLTRVCLQRNPNLHYKAPRPNSHQLEEPNNSDNDDWNDINMISGERTEKFMISVQIENAKLKMEFDTGATLTSMSMRDYRKLNIGKRLFHTDIKLRTYTGEVIKPVGVTYVKCKYQEKEFHGKLYLINGNVDPIFGRSWMKELENLNLADIKTIQHTNILELDQLLQLYKTSVFKSDLGKIPNYKGHFNLKENTQPIFIKPRRIPYALKTKVDEEIERLCKLGVITKVDHSEWGTPVVPVVKPNGSIRLCADYKVTLNKVILDEQYPIPMIEDIFAEMNGGKLFCTLDITQAYLNMVMDDESAMLQTLSTHKGTYKVNRLMFGVKVAPSLWQGFMDRLLQGLEGVKCFFDDIIIQGDSKEKLLQRLKLVLDKLKESNLRVNKDKCQFFKTSINYLGHTIDKDGLHKNKDKINAIIKTERPVNTAGLRTFLGMANFYNKFIPNLASITNPLNNLLKKESSFQWTSQCEEAFIKIKKEILSERVLTHFDPTKPLVLATDASPLGLGAVLSHRLTDGSERPVAFASRTLSDSEKRYSQIDKEATAIHWGLKKFFYYIYGRKFTLITDHKPLTSIFHPNKTLPAMSTMRLFHYAHFLSGFDYNIEYRTSANNSNADYLSRFPIESTRINKIDQNYNFQLEQINTIDINPNTIATETKNDSEHRPLLQALNSGISLRTLGFKDNEFTLHDGCILRGARVLIPRTLQERVLNELHLGHPGIVKMKLLARSFVYWKGIDNDIEKKVKSCRTCRLQQNEPEKAPLHHWERPDGPWQRLHIDFAGPFQGHQLFIIVDAFSKWIEIIPTKTTTTTWCVQKLKELFCTFGIPRILVSDNGRQFISEEFEAFLKDSMIVHKTSAPYHPATNGQAERFVQTVKRILRSLEGEGGTIYQKLLTTKTRLRRTPDANGQTPYELMFGREVRTSLHAMFMRGERRRPSVKHQPHLIKEFNPGDRIQARDYTVGSTQRWRFGTIQERLGRLHYKIITDDGSVWRRHIDQLLAAPLVQS
ncbi:uncharacterized protein K02A2.6-like [Papilio machaon]|uniref:uncharacterized protein K02A2.6-like n=1 Tax=Papilio machaon TaxID=76193 RepID=UPI001E666095|nr:uncharacterized protein K02A2.6-like [Papilio machaon]